MCGRCEPGAARRLQVLYISLARIDRLVTINAAIIFRSRDWSSSLRR